MTKRKRREVAGDSCCGTEKGRGQQCWEGRGPGADGAGVSEAGTRESRLLGSEGQAARLSGLLAKHGPLPCTWVWTPAPGWDQHRQAAPPFQNLLGPCRS